MSHTPYKHILISRTDAIGDVVLTLPMCGYIRSAFPGVKISFLGRTYTQPVIEACKAVNEFINYDELQKLTFEQQAAKLKTLGVDCIIHVFPNKHVAKLAKAADITVRIGTTNRIFHWLTCNKLVKLSRKKSDLHEAQLNTVLLKPLSLSVPPLADVYKYYQFEPRQCVPANIMALLSADKFNLILHPKSHGSGVEWPLDYFGELINMLPAEKFNIFISGSEKEQTLLADWIKKLPPSINNITGKMDLYQFVNFIRNADGLIASGTGPLHIAAASGVNTLGLFPCVRPIHPGRWAPLGERAGYLESKSETLAEIDPQTVALIIRNWKK
ncbi:glycosyltransferase family 9 protein [Mucilaginibacter sp. UR6-1]|uniref:glycosyltransferase family 9 protein n=1 Tax=Mucilaginibacter sp. UR6-1 TaxID=1435643 RepID=UPI001E3AED56|nr:glycosyltransferase family 9 protein [Mucilaginibacter sp. UR6-1]MCC8408379.1 glycosyltransferase family 9 protein [Mucilaginibacter sp. UR6-1]